MYIYIYIYICKYINIYKYIYIYKKASPYTKYLQYMQKASPYQCGSKCCNLCLSEKLSIICADPDTLLNKRTELISKCRHRNKFCWPTLRNSCHGMVFIYLLQFLYKDTEQN